MITECVFMERLAEGGVLTVSDLSADEKKKIYQHFQQFEATEAWAYDRLFKEGFAAWEMRGVLGCKVDYLERLKNEGVKWEIREAEGAEAVENQIEPDLFHFRLYYQIIYRTNDSGQRFDVRNLAGKEIAYMSSRPVTDTLTKAGAHLHVITDLSNKLKNYDNTAFIGIFSEE